MQLSRKWEEWAVKLKEFLGHTPLQVCMGALLGIATGILCNLSA